ncbi:MAG: hypothetical protein HRT67_06550 [Flavobacteriaceae bacterium]|nr:hypothetical protein [Flavobacteriaceae bacterium]
MKKFSIKISLVSFLLSLTILNLNIVRAQGPNAPEAASFEPVDATDMVNLSTGDFTYVLPILNVPSPEGGYPLALAYHSGIAMDQEASWTGLGWNLNPGAINRSINGYPDDYNSSLLNEYFYDKGDEVVVYSLSLSYSNGAASVGLGFSWGSHRSLGGCVSIGYGIDLGNQKLGGTIRAGTDGIGVNLGLTTKGGLTLGVGASSNGGFTGSIGFDNNGTGFNVSNNGSLNISIAQKHGRDNMVSLGFSLSSSGVGINAGVTNKTGNNVDGGVGAGVNLQFKNTVSMGDYNAQTSGLQIPLFVPTPIGIFSLSYGKQKFKYYLGKNENNIVTGPIYFNNNVNNNEVWVVMGIGNFGPVRHWYLGTFPSQEQAQNAADEANSPWCPCYPELVTSDEAFMDIYEISIADNDLSNSSIIEVDNAVFPGYDKYNVQAQGLSGSMSSRLFENGNLFGLSDKENKQGFTLTYALDGSVTSLPTHAQFNEKPYFYFDNEISTYLGFTNVSEANFNYNNSNNNILSYYANGVELNAKPRRVNSTYIDYYTIEDIRDNYSSLKGEGYLLPESGFDISSDYLPVNGIGAFKITSIEGKTYHYSLPVYNHEIVTRTHGTITARPNENQSYFEKRQLEPYATHWLLTAVTGPDYYDANNNGITDKDDYGYWVKFEYGKWSDAFVWKAPYGEDFIENEENHNIKTSIHGRKEVYYLDRVKTRTHTALFIKRERNDAKSIHWDYKSVDHRDDIEQDESDFVSRFIIGSQESLRLEKIILVKAEDDVLYTASGDNDDEIYMQISYNNSDKPAQDIGYKLTSNVINYDDNWTWLTDKAIKIIDFNYHNILAKGTPNTSTPTLNYGRLTLKSVDFKGKGGEQLMPPYSFDYINDTSYDFDITDKDEFGYKRNDNSLWSLNKITTPQGGEILIDYETHQFKNVYGSHSIVFTRYNPTYKSNFEFVNSSNTSFTIENLSGYNFGFNVGDTVHLKFTYVPTPCSSTWCPYYFYDGTATIQSYLGNNKYSIVPTSSISSSFTHQDIITHFPTTVDVTIDTNPNFVYSSGGIRVANLYTSDGTNSYRTSYTYGENESGIGYVSYLPYAPELAQELPYSFELPSPRVMYDYVTMKSYGTDNVSEGKIEYRFKVLKEKDPNSIRFGDLYEIETVNNSEHYNAIADKDVEIKSYTVKDNLASLGQLLGVTAYNSEGQILNKIENTYYSPSDPTPDQLGITKESYQSYKVVDYINNTSTLKDKWLINSSSRVKYPNLLKSSKEYKGGFEYETEFGELDTITGQALELLSTSSNGLEIKSKSIPAYYKYPEMGSKVGNINHENMLSQGTVNYNYIKNASSGLWEVSGVGITTWNNLWSYRNSSGLETTETNPDAKVWRKHKQYIWSGDLNPNGTYSSFTDNFDWTSNTQSENWINVSETTKYSRFSNILEYRDLNDNRVSSKMCDKDSKVLVSGNAWYGEVYYSGAEYIDADSNGHYFDGEVGAIHPNGRTNLHAHTGLYSVSASVNQAVLSVLMRNGEHRAGRYKISVWVEKSNYSNARITINGSTKPFNGEVVFSGNWVLMNHYEGLSAGNENISLTSANGTVYFDDFRVHLESSSIISYVYNEWDELECILNANNLGTRFEYDSQGRLIRTYAEVLDTSSTSGGFKKISENFYNYKN